MLASSGSSRKLLTFLDSSMARESSIIPSVAEEVDVASGSSTTSSGSSAHLPTTEVLVICEASVVVEEAVAAVDALSLMVGFS